MPQLDWRKIHPVGPLPLPRIGSSLCPVLKSGRPCLWHFGGADPSGVSDDSLLLTINAHGEWEWSLCNMDGVPPTARYEHSVVSVAGGTRVFLFGGTDGGDSLFDDIYVANTDSFRWLKLTLRGDIPCARNLHRMAFAQSSVFMWGGFLLGNQPVNDSNMYALNPSTFEWTRITTDQKTTPPPRGGHSFVSVGHCIYMFGGMTSSAALSDLYIFDTEKSQWKKVNTTGTWPAARSGHTCVAYDKKLIMFGGFNFEGPFGDLWMYDTEKSEWAQIEDPEQKPKPSARLGHTAAIIATKMVVVGGTDFGHFQEDVYRLELNPLGESASGPSNLLENLELDGEDVEQENLVVDLVQTTDGQVEYQQAKQSAS